MIRFIYPKIHYGWWIVTITFLSCFIFSGAIYFAFSLFVKPLQAEFGWERSTIMAGFTFLFLAIGIASPFAGKAVDRYGPKIVMSMGALIAAAGFVSLIAMDTPLYFYISYITIGVGGSAMGPISSTAAVSEWFEEKRGLAIGIMSMGIGLGGLVIAPFVGGVVIPYFGWKVAYIILGSLMGIMVPLAMLVIKTRPRDEPSIQIEKQNDERSIPTDPLVSASRDLTLRDALFSPAFWIIAGSFALSQFGITGTLQSQVIGLVSAFSKLFFGWLCDQVNPKYAFSVGVLFMAGGTFILLNIGPRSPLSVFWFYALIMGFSAGSWLPTMSMLVSTNFGLMSYGTIFGAVSLVFNIGGSAGPFWAGYVFDATRSYQWAFVTFIILYFLAIPAMLFV
ncbi:MAG: MFS transporter, partial [Deltaproteobacteria bacterium]|nr:MFS transporter [Deltaproteobacteria bacterium]